MLVSVFLAHCDLLLKINIVYYKMNPLFARKSYYSLIEASKSQSHGLNCCQEVAHTLQNCQRTADFHLKIGIRFLSDHQSFCVDARKQGQSFQIPKRWLTLFMFHGFCVDVSHFGLLCQRIWRFVGTYKRTGFVLANASDFRG